MKNRRNYTIEKRGNSLRTISVLITANYGKSSYYPYETINEYLEVNLEYSTATCKAEEYHGNKQWTYRLLRNPSDPLANWQGRERAIDLVGQEAIERAEKMVLRNLASLRKAIKESHLNPVWTMLKPIADDSIEHYKSDFTFHDALMLHELKPDRFIWMVRNTGTWTLTVQSKGTRELINYALRKSGEVYQVFWFDHGKITPVTPTDLAFNYFEKLPVEAAESIKAIDV